MHVSQCTAMFVMACMFDVNPETQLTQAIFHTQALSPNTFPSCSIAVAPSQENDVVKDIAVFTVYIFEPRLSSPANVYTIIRQRSRRTTPGRPTEARSSRVNTIAFILSKILLL